jgi:hypothetical protein
MIPVHRWEVCVISPQALKFFKSCFHFQFLKRSKFAAGHFHITTQLLNIHFASVSNYDSNPAVSELGSLILPPTAAYFMPSAFCKC